MAIHRVGVLDENGTKINTILVKEEDLATYWPGYGAALIDEGLQHVDETPRVDAVRPANFGLVQVTPDKLLEPGDTLDLKTGVVTKAVVEDASPVDVPLQ